MFGSLYLAPRMGALAGLPSLESGAINVYNTSHCPLWPEDARRRDPAKEVATALANDSFRSVNLSTQLTAPGRAATAEPPDSSPESDPTSWPSGFTWALMRAVKTHLPRVSSAQQPFEVNAPSCRRCPGSRVRSTAAKNDVP